ncbi:uncharacterized protein LOC111371955 [Olea europaea var. sylvestris]|uniref:uncharacterized protein LOC111371955 n=1 Tax=Olea europaea var. sylvestris TaxID=158386 RepID=UPI000C1D7A80|nr:uncharacterized protein LOC111371955 [Olea europaea var. sylvestris]
MVAVVNAHFGKLYVFCGYLPPFPRGVPSRSHAAKQPLPQKSLVTCFLQSQPLPDGVPVLPNSSYYDKYLIARLQNTSCVYSQFLKRHVLLFFPTWGYESTRGLNGGSSDGLPIPPFSELMTTPKERWSSDGENFGFSWDKITRFVGRNLGSPFNLQSCGVCAKLLTERSSLGIQKVIASNELSVVAVLICGHAYHAECLE